MPFKIIRNDITKVEADVIVNTANPLPVFGRGTDSAVYTAAGAKQLLAARRKLGSLSPGAAAWTPAFDLPARYIIHTVGPVWMGGRHGERDILRSCYARSLSLAAELSAESIAFPLIAAGVYGFPKDEALHIALAEIQRFLLTHDMTVLLVVFDRTVFELSEKLVGEIDEFIDDYGVGVIQEEEYGSAGLRERGQAETVFMDTEAEAEPVSFRPLPFSAPAAPPPAWPDEMPELSPGRPQDAGTQEASQDLWNAKPQEPPRSRRDAAPKKASSPEQRNAVQDEASLNLWEAESDEASHGLWGAPAQGSAASQAVFSGRADASLEEFLSSTGPTFRQKLFQLIDASGMDDVTVYKKANIDRKVFSRIRCSEDYRPRKRTAVAFAIALRLDMPSMMDLLSRAEIAFSPSSKFDLIITYFVTHGIYDIYEINAALFKYGQPILGE